MKKRFEFQWNVWIDWYKDDRKFQCWINFRTAIERTTISKIIFFSNLLNTSLLIDLAHDRCDCCLETLQFSTHYYYLMISLHTQRLKPNANQSEISRFVVDKRELLFSFTMFSLLSHVNLSGLTWCLALSSSDFYLFTLLFSSIENKNTSAN